MTMDIEKLKALGLAATPGEWTSQRNGVIVAGPMRKYTRGSAQSQIAAFSVTFHSDDDDDEPERQQSNAEFCAAANPAAVLELIAEVERLRAELAAGAAKGGDTSESNSPEFRGISSAAPAAGTVEKDAARLLTRVDDFGTAWLVTPEQAEAIDASIEAHSKAGKDATIK